MPKINETFSSPHQSGRGGKTPQIVVYHIADGTYEGTKSWFAQAASQTSSNFIVAQDGRICQCVPIDKMAWCNGTSTVKTDSKYYGNATAEIVRQLGGNANQYSASIEFEGFWSLTGGALTAAQLDSAVWLTGYIRHEVQQRYNHVIPLDRRYLLGHNEVTPKTRSNCPGQKFPWDSLMSRLGSGTAAQLIYRVQVGAFKSGENANAFLSGTVRPAGVDAFVKKCEDGLYRIQVGAFGVKQNADAYLATVRAKGIEAFIVVEER